MRPVDIGVGHDDDAAITQIIQLEILARAHAQRQREVRQLLIGAELFGAGAGDVQDLAAEREHRLGLAVARLLGRAAGRIPLDEEQFGQVCVPCRAVRQLAGKAQPAGRRLAGHLALLLAALALLGALDGSIQQEVGPCGVGGEPLLEPVARGLFRLPGGVC